ncbi:hypothetical protein LAZ67_X001992 [Cordylochernes scorpioides]|uniref:Uncharacterized protein n=1 Tax=Cordylochernes scorpioides TaxID=51811 RepID=A0ABY6LT13_9ARAC|nr:hypothetical protein LAZ67_X001992 [Cordylochernes scorpioides]
MRMGCYLADCSEQDDQLTESEDIIFITVGGSRKRPHDPDHANSGTEKGCAQAPKIPRNSSRQRAMQRPSKVHECQTTRQKRATFRARPIAAERVKLRHRGATLWAFPLRKRADRIVLGNVLFFVEDADLVAALRPYGQVTSTIQKMKQLWNFCWADARREVFITLRDGVKLSQIPARLDVKYEGVITHVYVTYSIKYSLCHKQGHKCANCLQTCLQEDKLVLPVNVLAARTQGWTKPPSTSNTMPTTAPTPADHRPQQTPPTSAVNTAPPSSRASNAQQEDLTPKPIPTTSALKNPEPKTSNKKSQGPVSRPPSSKPMPSNNSALPPAAELSTPIKQTPSTPSSPAAPSPVASLPVCPYETPAPELPIRVMPASSIQCTTSEASFSFRIPHQLELDEELMEIYIQLEGCYLLTPILGEVYEDEVLEAILYRSEREKLLSILPSPEDKDILCEFLGIAIDHSQDNDKESLTIGSTLLRAFPYRKRAEKIIIGNLPIAVKDDDIVAAVRPYCKVASMTYELVTCEGYSWTTGSREAFIFMNEGLKIHQLLVKLKCHRQGHRRTNCPRGDSGERSTRQLTSQHESLPPSTQTLPSSEPAATTLAVVSYNGPEKADQKSSYSRENSFCQTSGAKAPPAAAEVATSRKVSQPNKVAPILTIAPESRVPLKTNPLTSRHRIREYRGSGYGEEKIVQAIISERGMRKFLPDQKPEQLGILINLIGRIVDHVEDKACTLYKRLTHFRSAAKIKTTQ